MAGVGSTARVDGWIIKDRVDIEANLPDLGADESGSRGEGDLWQQCNTLLAKITSYSNFIFGLPGFELNKLTIRSPPSCGIN